MRDVEKRVLHEERRPQIRTASDLMGPGLASYAVEVMDWNGPETAFNGFYFSEPGSVNGPDPTKYWMGFTEGNTDGYGVQRLYQVSPDGTSPMPPISYLRSFWPGFQRQFSAWSAMATGSGIVSPSTTLTAGAGLTGGGDLTANRTFDVGAGQGIKVVADSVAVDTAVVALRAEPAVEIPDPSDLNTYVTRGQYAQSSSAEASRGTNYPAPYAGLLEVSTNETATMVWQRYTVYGSVWAIYQRNYYNGTWYPWGLVNQADTGWINILPASGTGPCQYRYASPMVTVRTSLSGMTSLGAGLSGPVSAAGAIPAAYRPGITAYGAASGGGSLIVLGFVGPDGTVNQWNSAASAITVARMTISYPKE